MQTLSVTHRADERPTAHRAKSRQGSRRACLGVALALIGITAADATSGGRGADQWVVAGNDNAGTYHSALTDINAGNVARLGYAWGYTFGTHRGLEATPLMIDGTLYTTGNFGTVLALDAATGQERWTYDPEVDGQYGRYVCCDAVNRGVAAAKGRIYVVTLDGYLHAIDAATGQRVWKADTFPARGPKAPYTSTGAPVIAGDLVLIGAGGGDFHGFRGYVAAFDLGTGALKWRFYTVPRDPKLGPQDQPHLVNAIGTWDPRHRWETGGGGAVWDGISYDPELKLIYIGAGNPAPYDIKEDGRRGGDNLYGDSIIAIRPTGQMAWYYQVVPGDMWDYDSTQKMVLATLPIDGKPRKVLMQASKNGFLYVLDRKTGAFISASAFAYQNWTKGLDPKTGRPSPNPDVDYNGSPKLIFPWEGGAHSWQPMSFDPASNRVFIPTMEVPDLQIESSALPAGLVEGQFTSPIVTFDDYDPDSLTNLYGKLPTVEALTRNTPPAVGRAFLRAWDPVAQKLVWEVPSEAYWNGGVLSTASGLVIAGDIAGRLNVYAASTGALLKAVDIGGSIMAAPITYRIGGIQYIAVMAGYGGGQIAVPFPTHSAAFKYGNQGRLIALKLDGGAVPLPPAAVHDPLPPPPPREGTSKQIAAGEILYNRFCSRCHVFGVGVLPDLRGLSEAKHQIFYDIVLGGVLSPVGMGRFDDVLTRKDVEAIHAYLIDEAWKAAVQATPPTAAPAARTLGAGQAPLSALPIVARVKVPNGPAWLGVGFGSVWVSKSESHSVFRLDPTTNKLIATIPVGADPELGIGIGLGAVWVADPKDRTLTKIDPKTNQIVRVTPLDIADDPEGSIGVGEGSVWLLTNRNGTTSGTLTRVDAATGKVIADIKVKPKSHAALVADHAVWVSNSDDGTVERIDPRTNAVVAEVAVHAGPRFMAAGAGSVWVLTQGDGTLARIDPHSNRVVATIAVGVPGDGGDLCIADGSVWVSAEGVPLTKIDPATNEVLRQYVGGRKDDTLRVGFGAAWVIDEDNGEVWKIDLARLKGRTLPE